MLLSTNNIETGEKIIKRECYVCGEDLTRSYKDDATQQNDLNASTQKFPRMILWNGTRKEVCAWCYKAHVEGLKVYKENNPDFKLSQPREF